ncbi:hypothetical protein ACOSP7_025887 [Xanthoceras sorbifolium]
MIFVLLTPNMMFPYSSSTLPLIVYVDEIPIIESSSTLNSSAIHMMQSKFALKTLGSVSCFLDFEASRSVAAGISSCQSKYIVDLLTKTNTLHCKPCPTPMC